MGGAEGDNGEATLADEGRIGEELIGFHLGKGDGFGDGFRGFEVKLGIFGIGGIDGYDDGRADGALFAAGVINDETVPGLHGSDVAKGKGIGDAVPESGAVALEVSEGIFRGFGFEKVAGHGDLNLNLIVCILQKNREEI